MFQTLIDARELKSILGQSNTLIVDCRFALNDTESGRQDFQKGHIPGAIYAHLDEDLSGEIIPGKTGRHPFPPIEIFASKCSAWGIDDSRQVIAYDQGHGGIAARLWFMLKWLGHENVAVLNGGWAHWQSLGFPETNEATIPNSSTFIPQPQQDRLLDVDALIHRQQEGQCLVIDSRDGARYRGENEPIDPVAGHIPGAISAPFIENLGPDGLFLDKAALKVRFTSLLESKDVDQAIFYCGSGVTACHNLLALHHIGQKGAKLYPGSWSDWITDKNRPVAVGPNPK